MCWTARILRSSLPWINNNCSCVFILSITRINWLIDYLDRIYNLCFFCEGSSIYWRLLKLMLIAVVNYVFLPSGDAYRDRRLTTNFELWVEIFCVLTCVTCFHMRIPKLCLYPECPYLEKRESPWLCQYQFYISNWYINGKVFTGT